MLAGDPDYAHHIIYEDETAVAFLNKYPILYGYTLVAPRHHREPVTGDFTREEDLVLQGLAYRLGEALQQVVPTERLYILSLGSQQANSHVHWHIVPLPPGIPLEQQQLESLDPLKEVLGGGCAGPAPLSGPSFSKAKVGSPEESARSPLPVPTAAEGSSGADLPAQRPCQDLLSVEPRLLSRLLDQMERVLDQDLIGLYLYGSLVTGDFDPEISDLDLLAVTASDIDAQQFEALDDMHNAIAAQNPQWEGRIEVQYIAASALETFKTQRSQIAVISPGEPFHLKEAGIDWLINWYLVREQGRVLFGPSPKTVIPSITKEEFLQAVREQARHWVQWANQPRDQRGQSYAILTMCRALVAYQSGEQPSKNQAALWMQERFPQWSSLIEKALVWRKASDHELEGHEETFSETAAFIHFLDEQFD